MTPWFDARSKKETWEKLEVIYALSMKGHGHKLIADHLGLTRASTAGAFEWIKKYGDPTLNKGWVLWKDLIDSTIVRTVDDDLDYLKEKANKNRSKLLKKRRRNPWEHPALLKRWEHKLEIYAMMDEIYD